MTSAGLRARDAPAGNSTGGAGPETEDDGREVPAGNRGSNGRAEAAGDASTEVAAP